jgi:hypothetical protein
MCFGPSSAQKQAAAESRQEADIAEREAIEEKAEQKKEDIAAAIEEKSPARMLGTSTSARAGVGRRSLFTAGGQGFKGRYRGMTDRSGRSSTQSRAFLGRFR